MFEVGLTIPKIGEIRFGYVEEGSKTHRYVGVRPYLVVSNDKYNKHSGCCEVIPFTTKRNRHDYSPVHVKYKKGEVEGLTRTSTLIIEGRDTLLNSQLSDPVGVFTQENWSRAVKAMIIQCPFLNQSESS